MLFDCPGQIELYTHLGVMRNLAESIKSIGFGLCSMYMLDITFINDHSKFISGCLMALSSMMSLGIANMTVLTKCDLVSDKSVIDKYLEAVDEFEFFPLEKE